MEAVTIPYATNEAKPAPGTEDRVGTLSYRDINVQGMHFRVSQWTLSATERAAIAAGADVLLWVSSPQHPTVSLSVDGVTY